MGGRVFITVVRNYLSHRIDSVLAVGQQKCRLALGSERLPHGRHVNQVMLGYLTYLSRCVSVVW